MHGAKQLSGSGVPVQMQAAEAIQGRQQERMLGNLVLERHRRYVLVLNSSWKSYWHSGGGGNGCHTSCGARGLASCVVPHTFFMTLMDVLSVGRRWLSSIHKYLSLELHLILHLSPKCFCTTQCILHFLRGEPVVCLVLNLPVLEKSLR